MTTWLTAVAMEFEPMPRVDEQVFRQDGDHWSIRFDHRTIRVPDCAGLHYLAVLLHRQGEPVHAVDLRAATGGTLLRGRRRRTPVHAVEPARTAVTKAIKRAIATIAERHPALAAHLQATVRCGYLCRYVPDPRHPIAWRG